jgi:hypothetical protein
MRAVRSPAEVHVESAGTASERAVEGVAIEVLDVLGDPIGRKVAGVELLVDGQEALGLGSRGREPSCGR